MSSTQRRLAFYNYVAPNLNGRLRGPFCMDCMNAIHTSKPSSFYSDRSEEDTLPIYLLTKTEGILFKINELIYKNGSSAPFLFHVFPEDIDVSLICCQLDCVNRITALDKPISRAGQPVECEPALSVESSNHLFNADEITAQSDTLTDQSATTSVVSGIVRVCAKNICDQDNGNVSSSQSLGEGAVDVEPENNYKLEKTEPLGKSVKEKTISFTINIPASERSKPKPVQPSKSSKKGRKKAAPSPPVHENQMPPPPAQLRTNYGYGPMRTAPSPPFYQNQFMMPLTPSRYSRFRGKPQPANPVLLAVNELHRMYVEALPEAYLYACFDSLRTSNPTFAQEVSDAYFHMYGFNYSAFRLLPRPYRVYTEPSTVYQPSRPFLQSCTNTATISSYGNLSRHGDNSGTCKVEEIPAKGNVDDAIDSQKQLPHFPFLTGVPKDECTDMITEIEVNLVLPPLLQKTSTKAVSIHLQSMGICENTGIELTCLHCEKFLWSPGALFTHCLSKKHLNKITRNGLVFSRSKDLNVALEILQKANGKQFSKDSNLRPGPDVNGTVAKHSYCTEVKDEKSAKQARSSARVVLIPSDELSLPIFSDNFFRHIHPRGELKEGAIFTLLQRSPPSTSVDWDVPCERLWDIVNSWLPKFPLLSLLLFKYSCASYPEPDQATSHELEFEARCPTKCEFCDIQLECICRALDHMMSQKHWTQLYQARGFIQMSDLILMSKVMKGCKTRIFQFIYRKMTNDVMGMFCLVMSVLFLLCLGPVGLCIIFIACFYFYLGML